MKIGGSTVARAAGVTIAFMTLASCATLNEDQCREANWTELGRSDGAAGRAPSHFERHQDACSKHGIPVDVPKWQSGWETGIRLYCTPDNGLTEGREGRYYANSCPADVAAGFERAYDVGKRVHEARQTRDRLERELEALIVSLDEAKDRKEERGIRLEISVKRSSLRNAERRLRDAERAYDAYVITNNLRDA